MFTSRREMMLENLALKDEVETLKKQNQEIQDRYAEFIFERDNPSKLEKGNVLNNKLLVLEKRLVRHRAKDVFANPIVATYLLLEITRSVFQNIQPNKEMKQYIAQILKEHCWEYRVFYKESKDERWVTEGFLVGNFRSWNVEKS